MITLITLTNLVACYAFYNTSKRALLNRTTFLGYWFQSNNKISKFVGITLILIGMLLSVLYLGVTSGILFFLILFITVLSLLIIVIPMKIVNIDKILLLLLLGIFTEIIIAYAS
ncbi:hypothetical protein BTO06_07200 [Tenacibaculum sp. SZ-18]|uniref:hypothetical protein n=1 Tax=Tenacibaculum sp. SZ-18 TaxID=754423 RepID=UPI000C2D692C|nr:hypothetical protein [Tenacibaculum sp. SZ-18]AUC14937.1 hypothetical protein BTO06_07200 [Tenacibaculum sp. SZ-18]